MSVSPPPVDGFDLDVPLLIIGAGACGLVAALAAHDAGMNALVIEADAAPAGSTALSAGLIPAAGTALQRAAGIEDTAETFASDIQAKAKGQNPQELVDLLSQNAAPTIDWLTDGIGLPFSIVDDFDYPGHRHRRMHGLPTRAGRELVDRLRVACETRDIDIICNRRATTLYRDADRIVGVGVEGPDGREEIGAGAVILACNGFGGNRKMVAEHMPDISDALWFGHSGNQGDAITWGADLGAETRHLGAYQGHGNVAHPQGILISWAVITEGGVQVNVHGDRFWDESQGYSEAARAVLAQPEGVAWTVFDARIAAIARQFQDFKDAEALGAMREAQTIEGLARDCDLPVDRLKATMAAIPRDGPDAFGRSFLGAGLSAPYLAVKVTGALFHTQGGLMVDDRALVCRTIGGAFDNLYAAGGAAAGVSGTGDSGYLSGNGLLSAIVLGRIAGADAAHRVMEETEDA